MLAPLHRALDHLAVWTEDVRRRPPEPCVLAPAEPLACFGALPVLPADAPTSGAWSTPSPLPLHDGDRLWVRAEPARAARRGTLLVVPPWKIRSPALVRGWIALATAAGWDAWLVTPPHHLERTLAGARSGEGFVTLDVARLRATFEQLVLELRVLAALGARRGPVGVLGLSLGALAAALAATAPEPLDLAALVAPPHLPDVVAGTGIGRRYRRLSDLAGARWPGDDAIAAALAPLDPAARALTARRALVAAGAHDRIALPAGPARLARAWGVPARSYPRGHLSLIFACRALRRDVDALLRASPEPRPRGPVRAPRPEPAPDSTGA